MKLHILTVTLLFSSITFGQKNSFLGLNLDSDWYTLTNYQQLTYFLIDSDPANTDPFVMVDFEYSQEQMDSEFLKIGFSELLLGFPRGQQTALHSLQPKMFLGRKYYSSIADYYDKVLLDVKLLKTFLIRNYGEPIINMTRSSFMVFKWDVNDSEIILTCREDELSTSLILLKK
jgi:hypothetical protein